MNHGQSGRLRPNAMSLQFEDNPVVSAPLGCECESIVNGRHKPLPYGGGGISWLPRRLAAYHVTLGDISLHRRWNITLRRRISRRFAAYHVGNADIYGISRRRCRHPVGLCPVWMRVRGGRRWNPVVGVAIYKQAREAPKGASLIDSVYLLPLTSYLLLSLRISIAFRYFSRRLRAYSVISSGAKRERSLLWVRSASLTALATGSAEMART